jgi:hypothetical protein
MPKLAAAEKPKLTEFTHNLLRGLRLMSHNITSENCLSRVAYLRHEHHTQRSMFDAKKEAHAKIN